MPRESPGAPIDTRFRPWKITENGKEFKGKSYEAFVRKWYSPETIRPEIQLAIYDPDIGFDELDRVEDVTLPATAKNARAFSEILVGYGIGVRLTV